MSLIQVARYSDVKYDFKDGFARVPVLENAFDQACFAHCALQPGHSITPDVYSVTEHNQLFFFTKGKGYITTPRQAWNINEPGVFVPEFDTERFTITCSADSKEPLEFLHIVTELNDYDKTCLVESRMVLPRFRTISQGWTYDEDFKDNSVTTSMMLLEHRNLGRLVADIKPRLVCWKGGHLEEFEDGLHAGRYGGAFCPVTSAEDMFKGLAACDLGSGGGVILFKGSRSNKLETLVSAFTEAQAGEPHAV